MTDQDRGVASAARVLVSHVRCDARPDRIGSLCHAFRRARATDRTPRVVVVGGGVSGLAAAHRIRRGAARRRGPGAGGLDRVGGSLRTAEVGGVVVDVGAEAMLNRRPEGGGAWPAGSGSAATSCTRPPRRRTSGTAAAWCRCRAR